MSGDRLRWAIFTVSVISSVDNPSAYLWRSFGRRLRQREHVATFFEARGNRALYALLQRERAEGINAFRRRFPDLHYHTFDQRSGIPLADWLTRTLATVDIALIDRNASPELIASLSEFSRPFLQTFLVDPGWTSEVSEPASLSNFTGLLVGNDSLISTYSASADAKRIYPFGPVPQDLDESEPTAAQVTALDAAAERAITTIIRVSEKIRGARGTQISANGRADHIDSLVPPEPD